LTPALSASAIEDANHIKQQMRVFRYMLFPLEVLFNAHSRSDNPLLPEDAGIVVRELHTGLRTS
jgi:hypothetical protein